VGDDRINDETHEHFKDLLVQSDLGRNVAAGYMERVRGHVVIVPKLKVAPTYRKRGEYSDHGDIWLYLKDDPQAIRRVVEVKQALQCDFTCRADWRFPDVALEKVYRLEQARYAVWGWFVLSKSMNAGCFARYSKVVSRWHVKLCADLVTGTKKPTWCAHPDDCEWFQIPPDPKWVAAYEAAQ